MHLTASPRTRSSEPAPTSGFATTSARCGADIADLGVTGFFAHLDPPGAMVGAGAGFLIDFVKPLHDMLTWVCLSDFLAAGPNGEQNGCGRGGGLSDPWHPWRTELIVLE